MARLGKETEFRDGLRVTDAETLDIARMVLVGKVNRDIVSSINVHGPLAVGLSGEDAGLITADERDPDLGFVGDVAVGQPGDRRAAAGREPDPGRLDHRRRPDRPGLQHQRRHGGRRHRRGARRREDHLPHRRAGLLARRRRPRQSLITRIVGRRARRPRSPTACSPAG